MSRVFKVSWKPRTSRCEDFHHFRSDQMWRTKGGNEDVKEERTKRRNEGGTRNSFRRLEILFWLMNRRTDGWIDWLIEDRRMDQEWMDDGWTDGWTTEGNTSHFSRMNFRSALAESEVILVSARSVEQIKASVKQLVLHLCFPEDEWFFTPLRVYFSHRALRWAGRRQGKRRGENCWGAPWGVKRKPRIRRLRKERRRIPRVTRTRWICWEESGRICVGFAALWKKIFCASQTKRRFMRSRMLFNENVKDQKG